jgi:hypothetical protein
MPQARQQRGVIATSQARAADILDAHARQALT